MNLKQLPSFIRIIATNNEVWIVGGAADINASIERLKDIDVLVPFHAWHAIAPHIPKDAKPNSFGGWKFTTEEGVVIDIWPGDIGFLLKSHLTKYVWNPGSNLRYMKCGSL
jgi:hypothetical protein